MTRGGKLHDTAGPPGLLRLVARTARLRCPACGQGELFRGWFAMHERCTYCDRSFHRGPGYFLGSIYFNYGVTAALVTTMYFTMFASDVLSGRQRLWLLSLFILVFPLWFFRYARSLWMAFDAWWDPWQNNDEQRPMDVK